jgi:hypothetical protein
VTLRLPAQKGTEVVLDVFRTPGCSGAEPSIGYLLDDLRVE